MATKKNPTVLDVYKRREMLSALDDALTKLETKRLSEKQLFRSKQEQMYNPRIQTLNQRLKHQKKVKSKPKTITKEVSRNPSPEDC